MIVPHIEYKDKMTINLGERTFELIYLKTFIATRTRRSGCRRSACCSPVGGQRQKVYQSPPVGGHSRCAR